MCVRRSDYDGCGGERFETRRANRTGGMKNLNRVARPCGRKRSVPVCGLRKIGPWNMTFGGGGGTRFYCAEVREGGRRGGLRGREARIRISLMSMV